MNIFHPPDNEFAHSEQATNNTPQHSAVVPLELHERLVAEQNKRIDEQKELINEQAATIEELRASLDVERQRNNVSTTASKEKLADVLAFFQKQVRYSASQSFWAIFALILGGIAPSAIAFYRASMGFVWGVIIVSLYGGICLYFFYRIGRYILRTLRKAHESDPVALCNTIFVYGIILMFSGAMEKLTPPTSSNVMTMVVLAGVATTLCSLIYGKVKTMGRGERFPDVRVARQFM